MYKIFWRGDLATLETRRPWMDCQGMLLWGILSPIQFTMRYFSPSPDWWHAKAGDCHVVHLLWRLWLTGKTRESLFSLPFLFPFLPLPLLLPSLCPFPFLFFLFGDRAFLCCSVRLYSGYIAQSSLPLLVTVLVQPSECWDYRYEPPCPATKMYFIGFIWHRSLQSSGTNDTHKAIFHA